MCKYCRLKNNVVDGERSNGLKRIGRISDGSRVLDLNFQHYITNDTQENALILENVVRDRSGDLETISRKIIKIKYCPFCGEKL